MLRCRSKNLNTPPILTDSARCAYWKPSASSVWRRKHVFTRPPPQNYMARCRKLRNAKPRLSTRAVPMLWPNFTLTGSPSTTAKRMACMPATASSSTMNRRCAVKPSSHARSRAHCRVSRSVCRIASIWAT